MCVLSQLAVAGGRGCLGRYDINCHLGRKYFRDDIDQCRGWRGATVISASSDRQLIGSKKSWRRSRSQCWRRDLCREEPGKVGRVPYRGGGFVLQLPAYFGQDILLPHSMILGRWVSYCGTSGSRAPTVTSRGGILASEGGRGEWFFAAKS